MVIDAVELTVTVTDELDGAVVVVVPVPPVPPAGGVVVVVAMPAVAVTFAVRLVVRILVAMPCEFVLATLSLIDPASVVKVTGTPASALPPQSGPSGQTSELPRRAIRPRGWRSAPTR